jgi:cell division protease FtsH
MDKQSQKSGRHSHPYRVYHTPRTGWKIVRYSIALIALSLFFISLTIEQKAPPEIRIMDLWKLIEKGSPDTNPRLSIEVHEKVGDEKITYRYSQLDNIRIGPSEITGTITREIIRPDFKHTKPETNVAFRTPLFGLENNSGTLFDLLKKKEFTNVRAAEAPSIWYNMLPMFVFIIPILIVIYLMVRKQGGGGLAKAFSRSRGKLYAQKDLGVNFHDIAGIDEAVGELREVVDFLKSPDKYQFLGGRIPKGVLLVGSPGTGKTLLARAIAGEAGVPFFSLSGSDFVEMFAGVGAARVRDMFRQAQDKAPCIVFIDELDSLGKMRGTSMNGHDEREQTLNALLVEMDGFNVNSGVIIMAATNRPETLDPALLRPGRFDRHVFIDRPDVIGRAQILKVHCKTVKLDKSVDIKEIARITSGFVGADLANLVNEAALLAARAGKPLITMQEFTDGVERITTGLEKRQQVMHADEKKRFAYHESAHALASYCLPNKEAVHKVSIIPRGLAAQDYTMQRQEGDRRVLTKGELEARIEVLLAGSVAEELILGDVSTGAQTDLKRATEIARCMVMDYGMSRLGRITYRDNHRSPFLGGGEEVSRDRNHSEQTAREIDEEIRHIINQALEKVRQLLEQRREALEALAKRLIEKEVISAEEVIELAESYFPSPATVSDTGKTLESLLAEELALS